MVLHKKTFPNETAEYRALRNEILMAEIELREKIQHLAELRQQLPLGGRLKQDYRFDRISKAGDKESVLFSELFDGDKDTLIIYSFMYSSNMELPCSSCTSIVDTLNANAEHMADRVNMVVVAKSPIERLELLTKSRAWSKIAMLSSSANQYNLDYFAETENGTQLPAMNVFCRRNEQIFHFYNTELLYADLEGHPRHVDSVWPIWNLLDMTPEGRGENWFPKLSYD